MYKGDREALVGWSWRGNVNTVDPIYIILSVSIKTNRLRAMLTPNTSFRAYSFVPL